MSEFPPSPLPPAEFLESYLPRAFAAISLPEGAQDLDVELGVKLEGEGGGEWVVRLADGALRVRSGARDQTVFTYVQSVDDWRGALWEGRGGAAGRQATVLFRPGASTYAASGRMGAPPMLSAIDQLRELDGVIRVEVTQAEGGSWRVDFKLGPGAIPEEPSATLRLSATDADAMARGELNPMEAFMAGRIQVSGDISLVMQMQAIQMQVASEALGRR